MKLFKFLKYDFDQGIIKYWKRYLIVILFAAFFCIAAGKEFSHTEEALGEKSALLEYGVRMFYGREPYVNSPGSLIIFEPEYYWIFLFTLLMFATGSYAEESLREFGGMLIVKSGDRKKWWFSKCLWCVCLNLIFFGLVWLTFASYIWLKTGELHMQSRYLFPIKFPFLAQTSSEQLWILAIVMPLLVGITSSLLMLVISLFAGSVGSIAVSLLLIVCGEYYATGINPYEYAMVLRYYELYYDSSVPPHYILNWSHGIIYLCALCVVLVVAGYLIIRKKNLIEKN
ncbi:MAG: hypothetical protein NC393_08940 [Clostridium sp.]|nr:hypothetical protein [Clostridium sp.]MCM1172237.1 hypothetical protein [Clostridium sp.]MCM1209281.1 hypothetical protein [Ruminococcus sp.]